MRNLLWMMCAVGAMMTSAAAHAAGVGKFSCQAPDSVAFQVASYDVSMSEANGRVTATVNMKAPKANKQVLVQHLNAGSMFRHCTLGPVGGGGGTYTLTEVQVTGVNDVQGPKKGMVDVKLLCNSATVGGKKK